MKDLLENLKKRLADEETVRYLKFMVIPLVVIILIIVIVAADRPKERKKGRLKTPDPAHTTSFFGNRTGCGSESNYGRFGKWSGQ